jgi:hypothetical protein
MKAQGSFSQASDMGRLYLYVPISQFTPGNTNNYQIGYRHEGDYICLNVTGGRSPLPGRFFYSTTLLPLWMTQGRTNLTFKIVSTGRIYPLGSSGTPATGNNYQFFMVTNSRSIYRAYTHTDPVLMPTRRSAGDEADHHHAGFTPTETVLNPAGTFYNGVNGYISGRMSTAATNLDQRVMWNFWRGRISFPICRPITTAPRSSRRWSRVWMPRRRRIMRMPITPATAGAARWGRRAGPLRS